MFDQISIIIPVYNSKEYLSECLNSICVQSYQNIEILLVNDGSTDRSGELCESFAKKDGRVRVIHQENQGPAKARKVGVIAAMGKYLCFVDSDDTIDKDYVAAMAEHIEGYDLVTSGCYKEYQGQWFNREDGLHEGAYKSDKEMEYLLRNMMKFNSLRDVDGILPYMYAKLYRTDLAKETLKETSDAIAYTDDSDFLYHYLLKCKSVYVTLEKKYYYHERSESICNGTNNHVLRDLNELYLSLYPIFDVHPLRDELLKQLELFIRVRIEYALSKLGFSYSMPLKDRTIAEISVAQEQPKISVLVPVYNVARYLGKCLDSLMRQTFTDFEIICIDDGSTDGSGAILDEYKMKDRRIKVIHKANAGYGSAMNAGLDLARGEYIGILESDDEALPKMYEMLYREAISTKAEVVKGNFTEVHEKEDIDTQFGPWAEYHKVFMAQSKPELLYDRVAIWSGLYRRDFLEKHYIRFQETPGASFQDTSFFFKVWYSAERMVLIPENTVRYRMDNAGSSINAPGKVFCICDVFQNIEEYLNDIEASLDIRGIVQVMKFMKYEWNFRRLSEQYQYAFLLEMVRQFNIAKEKGLLSRKYWPEWLWQDMENILADPENWFVRRAKQVIPVESPWGRKYLSICKNGILDAFKDNGIYIYGAGKVAENIYQKFEENGIKNLSGVLVTQKKDGGGFFHEIPIMCIKEAEIRKDALIFVAVGRKLIPEICEILSEQGYNNVIIPDTLFWKIWDV